MGYPFGGAGQSRYFYIQWHFENINKTVGVKDNASLQIYFTKNYRPIEFGVFQVTLFILLIVLFFFHQFNTI